MKNEQLKIEAIKKAYGEYYEQAKPSENGWCRFGNITHKIFKELDMDGFSSFDSNTVRPKSLTGIETNNGWVRIEEDGSNLPKEKCVCFLFNKRGDTESFAFGQQAYFGTMTETEYILKYFAHYQPIMKPEPPIY